MPTVQHAKKEVLFKIVYYGPGLGGKTTNLERLHAHSRPEYRGRLISMATEAERTIFFDLLPVQLGTFRSYTIRLHLCTVPGQVHYDATRQVILRNVDGVVFVVDSQPAALEANAESMVNLGTNLRLQGVDPNRVPVVIQYNKRDLGNVLSVEELRYGLRLPHGLEEVEASAKYGKGVFETLKQIVRECMHVAGDPAILKEGRSPSIVPGQRPSMYPEGTPRASETPSFPRPSRVPSFDGSK